jgi:hypothetical protein
MYFQIAELIRPVAGIDLGGKWNGWSRPRFPKDSALTIVDCHNAEHGTFSGVSDDQTVPEDRPCAWYDEATRSFWFYTPDSDETERFDPIVVDGVDYWDIGTDGWTWEDAPVTRITLTFEVVGGPPDADIHEHVNGLLDDGFVQNTLNEDGDWDFLGAMCTTEVLP